MQSMKDVTIERVSKRILVVSFSQSGQLHDILGSLLAPLRQNASISICDEVLQPVTPFPFPWSLYQFLDAFPESFQEVGCRLKTLSINARDHFDLVIIAYQVWYLSPSIPINSFLQSSDARRLLQDTPVVTIVAARNMWYRAHERIKGHLRAADARLIGHIALTDKALNLISVVTIVYWMLSGKRDRLLGLMPKPGISEKDIARCAAFGGLIADALSKRAAPNIQDGLNRAGACPVVPHLLFLEHTAARAFRIWSTLIIRKGNPGSPKRKGLVRMFGFFLACGIALLSPLSFLGFYLTIPLRWSAVRRQIEKVNHY